MATKTKAETEATESPQKDEVTAETTESQATETAGNEASAAPKIDPMEERVEIMIPRSEKNPGPVPIGVNGELILVKRGEYVAVKRKFAEALKNSFAQENASADYQDMLVREFKDAKM